MPCADPEGSNRVSGTPEKSRKYRVFSNTGPDPLKYQKATKPEYNVGRSSVVIRWWADDGLLLMLHVFGSSLPSQKTSSVGPHLAKLS